MIWGIFGRVGSGKTFTLTLMGLHYAKLGYPVFANYHVKPIKNGYPKYFSDPAFLSHVLPPNSLVLLQEIYVWLDSRMGQRKAMIELTHIILQSRKKQYDLVYDVQLLSSVDLRLRQNTDAFIQMMPIERCKINNKVVNCAFKGIIFWNNELVGPTLDTSFIITRDVFMKYKDYYDTNEVLTDLSDNKQVKLA